jgi:hypothetical protein
MVVAGVWVVEAAVEASVVVTEVVEVKMVVGAEVVGIVVTAVVIEAAVVVTALVTVGPGVVAVAVVGGVFPQPAHPIEVTRSRTDITAVLWRIRNAMRLTSLLLPVYSAVNRFGGWW